MGWLVCISRFNFKCHLAVALLIRLILVAYGVYHDKSARVAYTDVDYRVFTDAARHVFKGGSPFERHTYRYSPLIAYIAVLNLILHNTAAKIIFALVDLLIGILIKRIVERNLEDFWNFLQKKEICCKSQDGQVRVEVLSALIWLYNPMSIGISTRGNCDSIAGFLVLLVLYFLECKKWNFAAGLIYGIVVHLRLYPVIYSFTFFMYLSKFAYYEIPNSVTSSSTTHVTAIQKERKTIFKKSYLLYLLPNKHQFKFIFASFLSFASLTTVFYYLYGYKYLYESYIYHIVRKDTRHNFSLFFYLQYLTDDLHPGMWQKVLTLLPQVVLLLVLSVRFGLNRYSLNFAILTQTIVFVAYNSVLTSQYFVWIMAILPLCLWQIRMGIRQVAFLFLIWIVAQMAWLLPAYLLEFEGFNTFLYIWLQSVGLFCAHVAILGRMIRHFGDQKF